MDYMSTNFAVDSSSRIPFRAQTDTQRDATNSAHASVASKYWCVDWITVLDSRCNGSNRVQQMKKGPVSDFLGWPLRTRHPQNSRKQHYDKHIIKSRLSKIAIGNILQQITDVKYERWLSKVNLTFYRDEPHHIKIF